MLSRTEALAKNALFTSVDNNIWSCPILMSGELGAKNILGDVNNQAPIHREVSSPFPLPSPPPLLPPLSPKPDDKSQGKGKKHGENQSDKSQYDRHIWVERERRSKMKKMFSQLHALIPQVSPKADKSTVVVEAVEYIKELQKTLSNMEKQRDRKLKCAANLTGCDPSLLIIGKNKVMEGSLADVVTSSTKRSPTITLAKPNNAATSSGFLADVVASANNKSPAFPLPSSNAEYPMPTTFKTWSSPNVQLNVSGKDAHISICCPREAKEVLTFVSYVMDKYMLNVVTAQVSVSEGARMCLIHAQANVPYEFPETAVFVEELFKQAANEIKDWIINSF